MLGEKQALHHRYHIQRQLGHNPGRRTLLAGDLHTQLGICEETINSE